MRFDASKPVVTRASLRRNRTPRRAPSSRLLLVPALCVALTGGAAWGAQAIPSAPTQTETAGIALSASAATDARFERLTKEIVPLIKPYDIGVSITDHRSGRR